MSICPQPRSPLRSGALVCAMGWDFLDGRSQRTRSLSRGLIWKRKSRSVVGAQGVHEKILGARRKSCDLFVAAAWTTGVGVWSNGGQAVCLLRGTSVHSLPCSDDAGRHLIYRASSISLVQKKDVCSLGGLEDRSCWRWAKK